MTVSVALTPIGIDILLAVTNMESDVSSKCKFPGSVTPLRQGVESCEDCSLFSLCFTHRLSDDELEVFKSATKQDQGIARNEHLFYAGERVKSVRVVRSGSVKSYQISPDGEEVVSGFFLPGEVIGLDAISSETHPSFAVAMEDSKTCDIPMRDFLAMLKDSPKLNEVMIKLLSEEMAEARELLLVVGRLDAKTRVALFLLSLSRRLARRRQDPDQFKLTMDRRDIANYLGITIETVSRTLSALQRNAIIEVHGKNIRITDRRALEKIAMPGQLESIQTEDVSSQSAG